MARAISVADSRHRSDQNAKVAWLLSATIHAAVLAAFGALSTLAPTGGPDGVVGERGIVLVARFAAASDAAADRDVHIIQTSFVSELTPPPLLVERTAPDSFPPPAAAPTIGPLHPTANSPTPQSHPPGATAAQANARDHDNVETRVFGAAGKGSRFVYVFDRSASMEGAPLAAAKRELIASLQSLQPHHQFQIIFYNEEPQVMPDFRGRWSAMVPANEPGKRLAANFIGSVSAHGSTNHLRALQTALQMHPDVIFLLTDTSQPQLRATDLLMIRRLNQRAAISVVEFGQGPASPQYNFLQQLAAENGGQHVYVDLSRLLRYAGNDR